MPSGKKRVTMRKIAEVAGVHQTTVSLALRNRPSLPEATRKRIQAIAEQMGYRPDPVLEALNAYRLLNRGEKSETKTFSIAYLTDYSTPDGWKQHAGHVRYRAGVIGRAEELGYHFEDFWLDRKSMSAQRIARLLHTRNIQGVIVSPLHTDFVLDMPWEYCSWVAMTSSLASPQMHTIRNDHVEAVRVAYSSLRARGYRRIGLALDIYSDKRVRCLWSTGYWGEDGGLRAKERIPIYRPECCEPRSFAQWLAKARPDAILSITPHIEEILVWLKQAGWRVPEDIGVASLNCMAQDEGRISGVMQRAERIGATAVEVLSGLIRRNETGLPLCPQATLIDSTWAAGKTTKERV